MVTADRLNLIEEFEQQENNTFIFLTTFSFSPTFFDTFLFDKIRRNNPYAEVFVLIDSDTYHAKYDEFTARTGTDYHLLPVNVENGVFHPKVHLFLSETEEAATAYVGSANLTLQGLTNNLESVVQLEHDLKQGVPPVLAAILTFFHGVSDQLTDDLEYQAALDDLANARSMKRATEDGGDLRFLTNRHAPILDQVVSECSEIAFEELVLTAPFLSQSPDVVEKLVEECQIGTITLLLQEENHNLETVNGYRDLTEKHNIEFELRELLLGEGRRLHAKIIILKGMQSYLLVGSPNLTNAALLSDWNTGNVETCLFVSGADLDILDEFEARPVEDEAAFLADTSPDLGSGPTNALPVYTAKFSAPTNKLVVRTAERSGTGDVTIKTRDPSGEIVTTIDLSRPENTLQVNTGIPTEITVRFENDIGRRRVFHDKDRIFKRAKRTTITLQEISDSFDDRADVDLTDLVFVFQSLNENLNRLSSDEDGDGEHGSGTKSSKERSVQEEFLPPSRGRGSTSDIDSLLRKLTRTYETVQAEKQRQAEVEEAYTETEGDKYLSSRRTTISDGDKVERELKSAIRKANQLLLQFSEEAEDPTETWLEGQHLLFRLFIMLVGNLEVSEDPYEYIEDQIHENLEAFDDIGETNIEFAENVKRRFFTYVVLYNLLNRNIGRPDFNPRTRLMRQIYACEELVNKETYDAVREEVEANVERYVADVSFEFDQFRDVYAGLVTGSMGPKTVRNDIIGICQRMSEETDEEFKAIAAAVLFRISDVYSISASLKNQLRQIDSPADDTMEEAIEHLLQK